MMEGTTSSASLTFLERPEIENIAADSFGAGDSRRGIEIGWAQTDAFWAGDNVAFTGAFTGGKTGTRRHAMAMAATSRPRSWAASRTASGRDGISNIQIGVSGA